MRNLRNTERVMNNAAVQEIERIEKEKGESESIDDIRHLVTGAKGRLVLQEGKMDEAAWSCGMVAGLIHDIPTCDELIQRIMSETEFIVRERLAQFLNG